MCQTVELTSERQGHRMLVLMDGNGIWLPPIPYIYLLAMAVKHPDWVNAREILPDYYAREFQYTNHISRLRLLLGDNVITNCGYGWYRLSADKVVVDSWLSHHPDPIISGICNGSDLRSSWLLGGWVTRSGYECTQ